MVKNINHQKLNEELIERSGKVLFNDKLTDFLYLLLRDEISAGKVEKLVREVQQMESVAYCNGWLAQYANDLAKRLK